MKRFEKELAKFKEELTKREKQKVLINMPSSLLMNSPFDYRDHWVPMYTNEIDFK